MYSLSNNTAAKDTLNNNDPLVQLVLKEYGIYINNANNVFEKLQRREDSLRRLKDAPTESKITNSGQVTMDAHHPLLNVILPSTLTNPTGPYYPSVQTLLNDLRTVIKDRSIVTLDDDISKLRACHMNMATPQYAINALKQKIIPEVLGQKPVPGLGFEAPGEKYVEIFKVIATFAANAPRDVANGTILVAHKFTSAKKETPSPHTAMAVDTPAPPRPFKQLKKPTNQRRPFMPKPKRSNGPNVPQRRKPKNATADARKQRPSDFQKRNRKQQHQKR